jgi:hypothetical protein
MFTFKDVISWSNLEEADEVLNQGCTTQFSSRAQKIFFSLSRAKTGMFVQIDLKPSRDTFGPRAECCACLFQTKGFFAEVDISEQRYNFLIKILAPSKKG